jgi:hypothetical protein
MAAELTDAPLHAVLRFLDAEAVGQVDDDGFLHAAET